MERTFNRKLLLLSLLSGIFLWLGWPPIPLFVLLFIGFVPVLTIVEINDHHEKGSRWKMFLYVFLAFTIWNGGTTYWIYNATLPGAIGAIVANALLMSIPVLLYSSTKKHLGRMIGYMGFVVYWITYEYIHHQWELAWPWLSLGNGFSMYPWLVQWYEYTGIFGGSLWILVINILIFHWIVLRKWKLAPAYERPGADQFKRPFLKPFAYLGLGLGLPVLISLLIYTSYTPEGEPVEVVITQPNIDPYEEKFADGSRFIPYKEQLRRLINLSGKKITPNTKYVVWPETAISGNMNMNRLEEAWQIDTIRRFLAEYPHISLVTGIDGYEIYTSRKTPTARKRTENQWYDFYNTALQLKYGEGIEFYHKSKLVPGVERMPYPQLFGILEYFTIDLGGMSGSLGAQKERTVFRKDDIGVAPVICFESIFGDFMTDYIQNGSMAIFVITNDGWWGNTPGYRQHLYFSSLRAIETRKPVARSANTGISCFIDQYGDIRMATDFWVQAVIRDEILVNDKKTFYVKNGDITGRLAVLLAIITLLVTIVSRLTNRFYFRKS